MQITVKKIANNRLFFIVLIAVTLCTVIAFAFMTETKPVISDSIGYVYAGQQLGQGNGLKHSEIHNREISTFFYPHSFRRTDRHTEDAFLGYPPGFPFLIATFVMLSQQNIGAYYVTPMLAGIGLLVTCWLGYLISGNKWSGLWAAVILASMELYWVLGTAPWSEIPSLVFITGGVCFFILSSASEQPRTNSIVFAFLAGLFMTPMKKRPFSKNAL